VQPPNNSKIKTKSTAKNPLDAAGVVERNRYENLLEDTPRSTIFP